MPSYSAGLGGRHLSIKDAPETVGPARPLRRAAYRRPDVTEAPNDAAPVAQAPAPAAKLDAAPARKAPQLPPPATAPIAKQAGDAPRAAEKPVEKPAPAPASKETTPAASSPPLADARRGGSPGVVVPPLPKQDLDGIPAQIEQSEMLLRIGNVKGARDALDRGVKAGHPDAMVALARTYDPLELASLLIPPGVDDVQTAVKLYTDAAAKGSRVAKAKLDRLLAATASEPSQPRKK